MSKIDDGGPAFPCAVFNADTDSYEDVSGISVRDHFAASALSAVVSLGPAPLADVAAMAYLIADAMLRARGVKA